MAETAATRQSMAVITTAEHEGTLREWVDGAARNCAWVTGEENPDFEAILRSLDNQMVSLTLIDDAAMVYRDVSEGDILRFSETWNRNGMKIVFIAAPDRTRDDAFLRALPAAGVTAILPTRYFAGHAEGARALLLSMMENPLSADDIRAALDALPEEKKPLIGHRRRKEVEDVLASAGPQELPGEEGELMDEAAYFEAKRAARAALDAQAAPAEEKTPDAEPEPEAEPGIDIAALGQAIGIGAASATQAPEAEPEPASAEPEPKPVEVKPEPEPAEKAKAVEAKAAKPRRRCQKLAVAGVAHRAGCTHLAFSIAFAIKGLQPMAKVCCLMSDKREFDAMTSARGQFPEKDGYRTHKGVAFAFLGKNDPVPDGFDFIVIDCDVVTTRGARVQSLFATASRRFVVCGGAPWNISEVGAALAGLHPEEFANWTWCLFGASTGFKMELARLLQAQGLENLLLFEVPYQTDYLDPGSPVPAAFGQLFQMKSKRKKAEAADGERREEDEAR